MYIRGRLIAYILSLAAAGSAVGQPATGQSTASGPEGNPMLPHVKLETTLGDIVLELNAEKAPVSVDNFLQYVDAGFYNGTIFHRVMSNFMIQGGGFTPDLDQKSGGLRGPIKNEWKNGLKNTRGTIAMARLGGKADSATAQFFINVADNAMLDEPRDGAGYAVFGKVVEGVDTVEKIRNAKVRKEPRFGDRETAYPVEQILIKSAKIVGPADIKTIGELAAAVGKPPAQPAWEAKLDEMRNMMMSAQRARSEGNQAEAERLTAAAKSMEPEMIRLAQEHAEREFQAHTAKLEKELGKSFERTSSGLRSLVLKEGAGPSPAPTNTVQVHYTGWLLDGTKFQSSHDNGKPIELPLNQFIKGWAEGVGLMKVGEKRKLLIPAHLAYAMRPPQGSGIPLNANLVFDVELLAIR